MIRPKLYYTGGTDVGVIIGVPLSVVALIIAAIIVVCLIKHIKCA